MAGPDGIEPPPLVSKTSMISISPRAVVLKYRIELSINPYHGFVMPLNYKSKKIGAG
jgi:hypothetical protein